jgi:hypothetical protein
MKYDVYIVNMKVVIFGKSPGKVFLRMEIERIMLFT